MKHIMLVNPKGGCGKTTLSVHLAAYYSINGCSVALVDNDPQKSATDWFHSRSNQFASLTCAPINDLKNHELFDVMVHDLPAGSDLTDYHDDWQNTVVLMPVLATPTDAKAYLRFFMRLQRSEPYSRELAIGLVANRIKYQARYFRVLEAMLSQMPIPLIGQLRDTQAYVQVMERGISLFDCPLKRWQKDIDQWQAIFAWLAQRRDGVDIIPNQAVSDATASLSSSEMS